MVAFRPLKPGGAPMLHIRWYINHKELYCIIVRVGVDSPPDIYLPFQLVFDRANSEALITNGAHPRRNTLSSNRGRVGIGIIRQSDVQGYSFVPLVREGLKPARCRKCFTPKDTINPRRISSRLDILPAVVIRRGVYTGDKGKVNAMSKCINGCEYARMSGFKINNAGQSERKSRHGGLSVCGGSRWGGVHG